jgi:hypothetical protein
MNGKCIQSGENGHNTQRFTELLLLRLLDSLWWIREETDQHNNNKKNDTMPVKSGTVYDISVCLSRVAFALSLDTPLTSRPGIKQTLLNVEPPTSFINDNFSPFSIPAK